MGFHATNETLLRGPIDSNRPQALLFDHYALHLWFIENPSGALADFKPSVSCPRVPSGQSTPRHAPGGGGH